jgi:methylated-DNA-[protein]-cysteine S-methyltransferase
VKETYYDLVETTLGRIGFVWIYENKKPLIKRINLPAQTGQTESVILKTFPNAVKGADDVITRIGETIRGYLAGEIDSLSIDYLDLAVCNVFQRKVLLCDRKIPRGKVASYSGLARKLNIPKAARAVGNAQASNPFPIIIPCHRVVRSDGSLGGFGGGLQMKRNLLQLEGVTFDAAGKVCREHIWK